MHGSLPQQADKYLRSHRRARVWQKIVTALSCVVVFCTTYALILPAITMEQDTFCGKTEHTHTGECYTSVLICTEEAQAAPELSGTTDPETEADPNADPVQGPDVHTHDESCYDEGGALICGGGAPAAHTHTEACYETRLTCTLEEHQHTLACWSDPEADLESAAVWERTLPVQLSGDPGADLIAVARSQLGYRESTQNYAVSGGDLFGYTRYGDWYGQPYTEWNAVFASFCLSYAGVSQAEFPFDPDCARWTRLLADAGRYQSMPVSSPPTGSLVFLDENGDGAADRVGIVTAVDPSEGVWLETVEGDTNGSVARCVHPAADPAILGFGLLPGQTVEPPAVNSAALPAEIQTDDTPAEEAPVDGPQPDEPQSGDVPAEDIPAEEPQPEDTLPGEAFPEDTPVDEPQPDEPQPGDTPAEDTRPGDIDPNGPVAEYAVGTNWITLRDSGWFEEYSSAGFAAYSLPLRGASSGVPELYSSARAADAYSRSAVQVDEYGGKNSSDDGVSVSKTIASTDLENVFDITLQVQTPQKNVEIVHDPDMAVVIVMDISQTMNSNFGGKTRYQAAMDAAEDFLDKFAESNSAGISKIGYVAFNTDAHKIFDLQACSTPEKANTLKNTMRIQTGNIINASGYKESHSRFTNIEAGLKMAQDMLAGVSNQNKFIVFLSDGFPTTYIQSGYNGYDPYDSTGRFYDHVLNKKCLYGTSYSDEAAIRARKVASSIKNSGITVFSIGVDVGGQTIQKYIEDSEKANGFSVVDRTGTTYEIGDASSTDAYKAWLKNGIGSGYYYDSTNAAGLKDAYDKIFETIKETIATGSRADWVATDPLPPVSAVVKEFEFIGLYDQNGTLKEKSLTGSYIENGENTAVFHDEGYTISWDLKNSGYTLTTVTENGVTTNIITYELTYRVRLKNELDDGSFIPKNAYDTNGETTLQYRVVTENNGNVSVSGKKEINFPIPAVHGYLGELTFTKTDVGGSPLAGAGFTLTHDPASCTVCRGNGEQEGVTVGEQTRVDIPDFVQFSNETGTVTFSDIPSGHRYILTETTVPEGYYGSGLQYQVTVAYGNVTVIAVDAEGNSVLPGWDNKNPVVVNRAYYELPQTGGGGTYLFTLGGPLLAFVGLFGLRRNRRRRERGFP